MDTMELIRKVEADAKVRAKPDPVVYGSMAIGDCHRQGDVYITRISSIDGEKSEKRSQLAPGSTQGSRHTISAEDLKNCEFFTARSANALQGPIIKTKKPVEIQHPEHGHVTVPPGIYSITYQRQMAEELRRVAD